MNIAISDHPSKLGDQQMDQKQELAYSKKQVQKAGEQLIKDDLINEDPELYSESMRILSNWRACHITPLDFVSDRLTSQAIKIDRKAIIAKRLKRTPSIIKKLKRFDGMKLRTMQDIGGCRAILGTRKHVYKLVRATKNSTYRIKDYIKNPKEDGYRGIHLIGKFPNKEKNSEYYIEIQIRTIIQHAWATAVEIIDLFTNQALKSNQGSSDWKDFFRHISNEFALLESNINNEISSESTISADKLSKKLDVTRKFIAYSSSVKILNDHLVMEKDGFYLLITNTKDKTLQITHFSDDNFEDATKIYLEEEKKSAKKPYKVVALVSSNSISSLKEAYPNYFADSRIFLYNLELVLAKNRRNNPNWFMQLLLDFNKSTRQ